MAIIPQQPPILELPFAENGDKTSIPLTPVYGRASLQTGFPLENSLDLSEGGIPPNRLDFNGTFNLLSNFIYWLQCGGIPTWTDVLNYSVPSRCCASDGKFYKCKSESAPDVTGVGPKDPTLLDETYWILDDPEIGPAPVPTIVGSMEVMPFRSTEIPSGWYFMNGANYALDSPQGEVLNAFSTNFKTDWGIVESTINGVLSINVPNFFASDGTGATLIPCNGTNLAVGAVQEDTGRNITGSYYTYNGIGFIGGVSGAFYGIGGYSGYQTSATPGNLQYTLAFDASRSWGGGHTSNRFKTYGRGATPAIYLGV